jgi:dCMP deaminase
MLVNARIERLVTSGSYADDSFVDLFQEAGIEFELCKKPASEITYLP